MKNDPLYEALLELLEQPHTIADMLAHFNDPRINRDDISNRLKKGRQLGTIKSINPGILYRAVKNTRTSATDEEVLERFVFIVWEKYETIRKSGKVISQATVFAFVRDLLELYNKKYETDYQLVDGRAEDD